MKKDEKKVLKEILPWFWVAHRKLELLSITKVQPSKSTLEKRHWQKGFSGGVKYMLKTEYIKVIQRRDMMAPTMSS